MFISSQMCKSIDGPLTTEVGGYTQENMFSERHWPTCTCPAYKYTKATINFGGRMVKPECKHIEQARVDVCGWHREWANVHDLAQTEEQRKQFICPRCGGPTVAIKVLV
jgi:hypothetical protein